MSAANQSRAWLDGANDLCFFSDVVFSGGVSVGGLRTGACTFECYFSDVWISRSSVEKREAFDIYLFIRLGRSLLENAKRVMSKDMDDRKRVSDGKVLSTLWKRVSVPLNLEPPSVSIEFGTFHGAAYCPYFSGNIFHPLHEPVHILTWIHSQGREATLRAPTIIKSFGVSPTFHTFS